jgi:hypothetical protein
MRDAPAMMRPIIIVTKQLLSDEVSTALVRKLGDETCPKLTGKASALVGMPVSLA